MNGEVTEINIKEGYIKVKGYYWPVPSDIVSAVPYAQSSLETVNWKLMNDVTELEVIFRPTPYMVMYDEETDMYRSAIFEDIDIGDMIFTAGPINYPATGIIFKNHNK